MKRVRAAALAFAVLLLFVAAPAATGRAADREIELRGTLLCRVDGDARRERPIESQMLIVEPVGHPPGAEVIGEAGLFRIRVPEGFIDQQVILRIHQGREEVHSLSIFLDAARVKQVGDRRICQLGAFPLPGRCDDRTGSAAEAVMIRDEIRQTRPTDTASHAFRPRPWQGGILAALAGGGAAALGGASSGSGGISGSLKAMPQPGTGDWPAYQQFCATPALGRTMTAGRLPDEAALWNPAALALAGGSHLSIGYGETNEVRGSLAWDLPVADDASWLVPRTGSGAVLAYLDNETTSQTFEVTGATATRDDRRQDVMATAGLGWRLASDLAVSAGFRGIWQERGSFLTEEITDGTPGGPIIGTNRTDLTREHGSSGVDLTLAWEARHDLRVGIGAYSLFGGEYRDSVGQTTPVSRGAVGASWTRGRWALSGEGGLNAGELNAAAAIEYRATRWLGLSAAAGSRYEAVQGGIDVTVGPLTGRARIRTDDFHDVAGWFGLMLTR